MEVGEKADSIRMLCLGTYIKGHWGERKGQQMNLPDLGQQQAQREHRH